MSIRIIAELKSELDAANKELAEVKTEAGQAHIMVDDCLARITKAEAERDRLRNKLYHIANCDIVGTNKALLVLKFRRIARKELEGSE